MAQGLNSLSGATLGVVIHSLAADLQYDLLGNGILASDLLYDIPRLLMDDYYD